MTDRSDHRNEALDRAIDRIGGAFPTTVRQLNTVVHLLIDDAISHLATAGVLLDRYAPVQRSALGGNQPITADDLARIRKLEDFDLTMLLSEIHDHGWPAAQELLPMIEEGVAREKLSQEPKGHC